MFFGVTTQAQKSKLPEPLKIYKSANYEVKSFDYEGLEAYMTIKNDTTYVYNFWATWCAPLYRVPSF
jgi:thiol-disulfide isomerase/thioredoxin